MSKDYSAARKEYRLKHFVMSPVDAPPNTPVIYVDHGMRVDDERFISLAKLSDLEALLSTARSDWAKEVEDKLIQAIDQLKIPDGERLHILGAELTKHTIKEILGEYR